MILEHDAKTFSTALLRVNFVLSLRWRRIWDDCIMHRFAMSIHTDDCTGMGFDYRGDALSNNLGIRFGVFRTCLKAIQLERLRYVSEEALWPFFDKHLGRFSTKTLADFRPKFLASFRPKLWPISDQKMPTWIGPMGLGEGPSDATLAFANFHGKLSQLSREAFPDLRAKPSRFWSKTKIRNQKRPRFCADERP